ATAFALAGPALAADGCEPPDVDGVIVCNGNITETIVHDIVDDLTVVVGNDGTSTVQPDTDPVGIDLASEGRLVLENEATVTTTGPGILARGGESTLVTNAGDITSGEIGIHVGGSMYGPSGGGDATVANSGTIDVDGSGNAAGIEVMVDGDVSISNDAAITADAAYFAAGIATSTYGAVTIENTARIEARADFGAAGIVASGETTLVVNGSDIEVEGSGYQLGGISSRAYIDAAAVNSGQIRVQSSYGYASGVMANDFTGEATIDNEAGRLVHVDADLAAGLGAVSYGDGISIDNAGTVEAIGTLGAAAVRASHRTIGPADEDDGDITVVNSGSLRGSSGGSPYGGYGAYGVYAASRVGTVSVTNSGSVEAESSDAKAIGISTYGESVAIASDGDIRAESQSYSGGYGPPFAPHPNSVATGIYATGGTAVVDVGPGGSIEAHATVATASGVEIRVYGDGAVTNAGSIDVEGYQEAAGLLFSADDGDVSVHNLQGGEIHVRNTYFGGRGIASTSYRGNAVVTNAGLIDVYSAHDNAVGISVDTSGNAVVENDGAIQAASGDDATGIVVYAAGDVEIASRGPISIQAGEDDDAEGILIWAGGN